MNTLVRRDGEAGTGPLARSRLLLHRQCAAVKTRSIEISFRKIRLNTWWVLRRTFGCSQSVHWPEYMVEKQQAKTSKRVVCMDG